MESDSLIHPIGLTTFQRYWKKLVPQIQVSRYKTDMCNICHQFLMDIRKERRLVQGLAGMLMIAFQSHLAEALMERVFYNNSITVAREEETCKFLNYYLF